jgi:hypothetical protein
LRLGRRVPAEIPGTDLQDHDRWSQRIKFVRAKALEQMLRPIFAGTELGRADRGRFFDPNWFADLAPAIVDRIAQEDHTRVLLPRSNKAYCA